MPHRPWLREVSAIALGTHRHGLRAPSAEVVEQCTAVERAIAEGMGCQVTGLLSSAGFACLAVSIPSLKITSRGLARVSRSEPAEAVELFVRG